MKKLINWVALRLFGATPYREEKDLVNPKVHTVEPKERGELFDVIMKHRKENDQLPRKISDDLNSLS